MLRNTSQISYTKFLKHNAVKTIEAKVPQIIFFIKLVVVFDYNFVVIDYQVQNLNILKLWAVVVDYHLKKCNFSSNNIIVLSGKAPWNLFKFMHSFTKVYKGV